MAVNREYLENLGIQITSNNKKSKMQKNVFEYNEETKIFNKNELSRIYAKDIHKIENKNISKYVVGKITKCFCIDKENGRNNPEPIDLDTLLEFKEKSKLVESTERYVKVEEVNVYMQTKMIYLKNKILHSH